MPKSPVKIEKMGGIQVLASIEKANELFINAVRLKYSYKFAEELAELDKAIAILDELDDCLDVLDCKAACYQCKAVTYQELGREKESVQVFEKVIEIRLAIKHEDKKAQIGNYVELADAYRSVGNLEKAFAYANKVLDSRSLLEGHKGAMQLYLVSTVLLLDENKYLNKIKNALALAKTLLIKANAEKDPKMIDLHLAVARIASSCEHDDHTALLETNKAWELAESTGIMNSNPELMMIIAKNAISFCQDNIDETLMWNGRLVKASGMIIDNGDQVNSDVVYDYVFSNIMLYIADAKLDESVTVERVVRCAELMKDLSQDKLKNAQAQWLAGCVVIRLGKTGNKRKAARLVMDANRVIGKKSESDRLMVAVGEGCIGDYHFQRGEYELAEQWYQAALKYMKTSRDYTYELFSTLYSDKIAECRKQK
jgi:tetratricopeptide (TPR) repeat protein